MNLNIDLGLVQSQKILLTPQLKQALEILRMNSQELFEYVEEELEANPVLEIDEGESYTDEEDFTLSGAPIVWNSHFYTRNTGDELESYGEASGFDFDNSAKSLSLKEHLLFQLQLSDLDDIQNAIAEYLIDNIDENGYFTANLGEAAAYFNTPLTKVKKVLELLQTFDPPGIFARNLKECLTIQLKYLNNSDKDIQRVIEDHLDELAANQVSSVAKKTGLSTSHVSEIFNFIRTLEPKPGRAFYQQSEIKFLIPDIIVKREKEEFSVLVNEDAVPLLCINSYYKKIVSDDISSDSKRYIQNKIDNAVWLIKCIEQRKDALRKITEEIVVRQREFFEKGVEHIKPIDMKDICSNIDMHETTISRAVSGKYLQCSWGIFEIRYFFTEGRNRKRKQEDK